MPFLSSARRESSSSEKPSRMTPVGSPRVGGSSLTALRMSSSTPSHAGSDASEAPKRRASRWSTARTRGTASRLCRSARISEGVATAARARPASRSMSWTFSSAAKSSARSLSFAANQATCSCRRAISARSRSGRRSQRRSIRPPIAVRVSSSVERSDGAPPALSKISRLRTACSSRTMKASGL